MKYLKLARIDHWIKNLFMLPGSVVAFLWLESASRVNFARLFWHICLSFLALCFISSANYTINEYIDREHDKRHPTKRKRNAVVYDLKLYIVLAQFLLFWTASLFFACFANRYVALFIFVLGFMGIVYNVPPMRTKDIVYLDVISESVNNSLRFSIGWYSVTHIHPVPASGFIVFWGGGFS